MSDRAHGRTTWAVVLAAGLFVGSCSTANQEQTDTGRGGTVELPTASPSASDSVPADQAGAAAPASTTDSSSAPSGADASVDADAPVGGPIVATLNETSAPAFARVAIDHLDPVHARDTLVHIDGYDVLPRVVLVDDDGPFFIAPMHPADVDGGELVVHLETPDEVGPPLGLVIEPLPAAPGGFADARRALADAIETRAREAGLTIEQVENSSIEDLPPLARHLHIALLWMAMVDEQLQGLGAAELDLLDNIAGAGGLADLFADEAVAIPGTLIDASGQIPAGFAAPARLAEGCIHNRPTIETIEELSAAMLRSSAASSLASRSGARGQALEAVSWGLSAGGFAPGIVGKTASVMSLQLAAFDAVMNGLAGLNPSRLASLQATISTTLYEEDFDGSGSWNNVVVTATSTGWTADADAINVLLNLASALAPGGVNTETLENIIVTAGDEVLVPLGEITNRGVSAILQRLGTQAVDFCPEVWTLPVNSPGYVEGRVFDRHFDIDNAAFMITPQRVGRDLFRLEVLPEKFAGRYVKLDTQIETKAIEVTAGQTLIYVEPGATIPIDVTIEHAQTPTLSWDPGAGSWDDRIVAETSGSRVRPLKTPEALDAYPFTVSVESTTTTGLRQNRTPPRRVSIQVQAQPFFVVAIPDEIRPGEVSMLRAYDQDDQPVEVSWQRSGGQLSETGTGTATFSAEEPGQYTITATNQRGDPVSVTVHVLGGDCSFAYTIGGTRFIGQEGDIVYWSNRATRESRLLVGDPSGQAYSTQLTFTTDDGLRPQGQPVDGVGSYFIRFADFTVAGGSSLGASVFDSGELQITSYEAGSSVAGEGAGSVLSPDGGYSVDRIPFSIEFAAFDNGDLADRPDEFRCVIAGPPAEG